MKKMKLIPIKKIFFLFLLSLFLIFIFSIYKKITYKELWYSPVLGIKIINNSDILYDELNSFQKENKISARKLSKMIGYLNVRNAFLRYGFKGESYFNNNILIFYDKYSIGKDKPILLKNDDFFIIKNNSEIVLKNNISNICSIHIIGYKGNDIIHMNTFDSFGIYLTKLDDKRDHSMICQDSKGWDIKVKSIQSADISDNDLNLNKRIIEIINKVKYKNGLNSHQISEMIMSSNIEFSPSRYKKIYDDENILIDKGNYSIYSRKDHKNKIYLNKKNFLILYQDMSGKIGRVGEIDSIDGEYMIVIKKEQATYIYDDYLSKLRTSLITD